MKKTVLFVILDQYADWEGAYLAYGLNELGKGNYEVKTVSLTTDPVQSMGNFHAIPDYSIQTMPKEYEAMILVGGMSWRTEPAKQIKALAADCISKGKVLGAICDACAYLGTNGFLNTVYHTANDLDNMKQWAKEAYTGDEKYICKQAVSDQNIVTANGTAALEFAKEVLLTLKAAPEEAINGWYGYYSKGRYPDK